MGFSRILDIMMSEFSIESATNEMTSKFICGPNKTSQNVNLVESYVPLLVANNVSNDWYLDSRAINHVCQDASALKASAHYSGNVLLLMGDGTHVVINNMGNVMFSIPSKVLNLSYVLHVPKIHKNLLSSHSLFEKIMYFLNFTHFIMWLRILMMCYCRATLMRDCTDFHRSLINLLKMLLCPP